MNQTPVSRNFETQGAPWKAVAGRSRIAIISASWHTEVVYQARDAAQAELQAQGVAAANVQHFGVPGAFEIPLLAKKLVDSGRFDAVIACALIVNGGIYRHEFVTSAVIDGLMRVQLDSEVPVFSAVLTPRDFHEHVDHVEFFRQHFVKKGVEVAHACLSSLDQLARVEALGKAKAA
ncbi:6,7-dimethyl-8-ribityllumazine synthase [Comamonas phosphati]|nr:6,7-dimethyl-8-ribityllumazine synthase [Comamonas phosphati]